MKEWIKPGQRVVSLYSADRWQVCPYRYWVWFVTNWPRKGAVYTIRSVDSTTELIGLAFEEFANSVYEWPNGKVGEAHFDVAGFRPVKETKTDISIFTKMLGPQFVNT